jgi:GT2 family glycosyltransferase
MKISVVMLTCNGGPKLKEVVAKLRIQQTPLEVEFVAVDSESTVGSCEVLQEAGFRVHTIERKKFSFGPARDFAFRCSAGDVIVTLSQDVVPVNGTYLRAMTDDIVNGKADVVQGQIVSPPGDKGVFLWDRNGRFYFTSEGRDFFRKYGDLGLSCACLALSRAAWQATGFSGSAYATDKFIQRALVEKGFRIAGTRDVVAWHGHAYSLRGLVKRCLNEGYGWRVSGAKYKVLWCLRDLTIGFAENATAWLRCLWSAQARDVGSILFFQIRPICVLIGNRFLKQMIR